MYVYFLVLIEGFALCFGYGSSGGSSEELFVVCFYKNYFHDGPHKIYNFFFFTF